jgi:hypothetical protein
LLGAAASLGSIVVAAWLAKVMADAHGLGDRSSGAAMLLPLAAHAGVAFYGASAMGTMMTTLLITLGVGWHALDLARNETPRGARCYLPLALLTWTRPEGPLIALSVVVHRVALASDRRAELKRGALAVVLPIALLAASRLWLYGRWLPNTFAAKPSTLLSHPAGAWAYLVDACASVGLVLAAALIAAALLALHSRSTRRTTSALLLPLLLLALFSLYSGGDWMPHGRFMLPALPALAVAAALGVGQLAERAPVAAIVTGALALYQGYGTIAFYAALDGNRDYDHALRSDNNVAMAQWMARHLPSGRTVLSDEIGAIGLYSGLVVMDLWGLTDPEVAAMLAERGFNPYNSPTGTDERREVLDAIAKVMLARKPDYLTIDYRAPPPLTPADYDPGLAAPDTMRGLTRNMDASYHLIQSFALASDPPKTFLLFARAD